MVDLSKIELLAKEKKLTLKEVSERAGISYQALNKLIRNNSTKIETLVAISQALGVSPVIFFGETQKVDVIVDYLREKDQRIEELIVENERLKAELNAFKKEDVLQTGNVECADAG